MSAWHFQKSSSLNHQSPFIHYVIPYSKSPASCNVNEDGFRSYFQQSSLASDLSSLPKFNLLIKFAFISACMSVCMYVLTCVYFHRGQNRAPDSLELEWSAVLSYLMWVHRIKFCSSERTVTVPDQEGISPPSLNFNLAIITLSWLWLTYFPLFTTCHSQEWICCNYSIRREAKLARACSPLHTRSIFTQYALWL